jgi:hypothetical protein
VIRRLVVLVGLAATTVLSVLSLQPPAPRPAGAPAGEFSAARAFEHVRHIGAHVHVTGSPAADDVRAYIVDTLTGFGLRPQVQDTTGVNAGKFGAGGMAHVRNVIAVLPGQQPTGRVILMAHYDSVQVSYGANDDGAGVSNLLETARAMSRGARPRNDVVFVFTDAEEACLCGSEAFVHQYPLAQQPAVVLNFESRGSRGPSITFETSQHNAGVVSVYARVAPHPVATSVAVEVYRRLSNDTDFTPVLAAGRFTGLNAAYIDGSAAYHSPRDRPSNLDLGSLQSQGDNALALAREFGRVNLGPLMRPAGHDDTYFPLPFDLLPRYPGGLVWPIAIVALLAVGALGFVTRRRGLTTAPRLAAGFGIAFVPVIGAAAGAQAFWALLVAIRPGYAVMADPHRPLWYRLAVVALTGAILLLVYGLSRRRIGAAALGVGALGLLAVLGVVFAALIPGGSYLVALPALFGAVAGFWGRTRWAPPVAAVGAILILVPAVTLFFPALGLTLGAAPALFAALLGLALVPVFLTFEWRLTPAAGALGLAVVLAGVGLGVDRWDPAHPMLTQLMYAMDEDSGTARWVSLETSPGPWTAQYVHQRADLSAQFPALPPGKVSVGPAQVADLPPTTVAVESDTTSGGRRTVRLRFTPGRPVRLISFFAPVGERRIVKATVDGRDALTYLPDQHRFGVVFNGPPAGGLEATLVLADGGPLTLRVIDGSDGLDGLPGFKARPADVGVFGSHSSELVAVAKSYRL